MTFSVIITAYNREDYINKAIDSVMSQTFRDYELIVVDDGSTDRTQEIIMSYGEKVRYIWQENQGSEMAYKTGVSHATGEYMAFLDSDDYFLPNALATYDRIIRALDSPPIIIGAMQRFGSDEELVSSSGGMDEDIEVYKYRDYLSKDIAIGLAQSRIVMKKTLFELAQQGTGAPRARNMNDYRLILRAGIYGPCVIATRPITLAYRYHETQSSKNIAKMCQGVLYLIDMVRHGQRNGEPSRLFDRYAYLGGIVNEWIKKAYRSQLRGLALEILAKGWPMVIAALLKKIMTAFQQPAVPQIIMTGKTQIGTCES